VATGPPGPFASDEACWEADEPASQPDVAAAPALEPQGSAAPGQKPGPELEPGDEIDLAQFAGPSRAQPWRLRHLMYLIAAVAVALWLGILLADKLAIVSLLVVTGFVMLFVVMMGAGVVMARRRSTQQDSLLWVLAIAAERNMPLAPAVAAFADQYRGRMYQRLMNLAAQLNWGAMLPEALQRARMLVSRDTVLLAWVGQASGLLPKALRLAAGARSTHLPIWTAIASRLSYILVLLLVMQGITSFMLYYIIPKFESIFKDFNASLPPITVMIIDASHFIIKYGSPTLLLPLFEVGLLIFLPFSFLAWGNFHVPLFDRLLRRRHSALVLRSLSLMVEGNKPISLGLSTLATHYPTTWVRWKLIRADSDVKRGVDWIQALWQQGLIRATDAEVLASAVAVGNLAWALSELAETTERRLANRFQAVVQTAFPLVVVSLGMLVFIMALGYFLPLIKLIQRLTEIS
jgi:type II secretory pathway component PulF